METINRSGLNYISRIAKNESGGVLDVSAATISAYFRESKSSSTNVVTKTNGASQVDLLTNGLYIIKLTSTDFTSLTKKMYYVLVSITVGSVVYSDQFLVKILGNTDETATTATATYGTTAERPTLTTNDVGYEYFDTTIGSPIWWDGSNWV